MSQYRKEKDSMGFIDVPADKYWGAQTQRSAENFKIGGHRMPKEIINAFAVLKMAAAQANFDLGVLPEEKKVIIEKVCQEIMSENWTISSH